jgi:hypothetical protein
MKIDLRGIFEGIRNAAFPPEQLKELIQTTMEERMQICQNCPLASMNKPGARYRPDDYCTVCGCNLKLKTQCLSCKCPQGKWGPVVSKQEDELVKSALNDTV